MKQVRHTEAIDRARCLPRRDWQTDYPIVDVVEYMTNALRQPGGTGALRPAQAVALAELDDFGGGFWPLRVGAGKTLLSLLTPVVVGAKRPVLLIPASLREKTVREAAEYAKDWKLPAHIQIQSYQRLSRDYGGWLDQVEPDLIIDISEWFEMKRSACLALPR